MLEFPPSFGSPKWMVLQASGREITNRRPLTNQLEAVTMALELTATDGV